MSADAFLGAGEFEDWHADIDRSLLDGRDGRVLVLATAAAPEGEDVFRRWVDKGLAHYAGAGIAAAAPELRTSADAHDPAIVAALEDAAVVFFSGGNPAYLAQVLDGSPFWTRVQERVADGSLYDGRGERTPRRPAPPRRSPRSAPVWRPAGSLAGGAQRQREHAPRSRRGR